MTIGKKIGIAIGAIILTICLVIDIWYAWIYFHGPDRIISKTFKVSTLTLADGTTTNVFEVEYFANEDGSGYEAFEVKFTNYLDETREQTFIQGLQYIADTTSSSIDIVYNHNDLVEPDFDESSGKFGWKKKYYNCQNAYVPSATTNVFNYMSSDGEEYLKSTNPINMNTGYKIQIGEDIYIMRFKGLSTPQNETTSMGTVRTKHDVWTADIYHNMYYVYDVNYFSKLLYESIKTAEIGANADMVFEWGNLFNYYKFDTSTNKYDENPTDYENLKLISGDIKSYYSIRVKTHAYGLSKAGDSMFGSVLGNQNFSLNGDYSNGSYFIGRTVVNCDVNVFDFVTISDNNVALKLSSAFINYYFKYKKSIVLSIEIDLDFISNLGYNFVGFTSDSGLDDFSIYKCYSVSQGEIVEDFVDELKVVEV